MKQKELAEKIKQYLNCPCKYFEPIEDDKALLKAYYQARKRGKKEGFVPVIVAVDEILLESLIFQVSNEVSKKEEYGFDPNAVAEYREKMMNLPLKSGEETIQELHTYHLDVLGIMEDEEDMLDLEDFEEEFEDILDEQYEEIEQFSGYWENAILLAEIPVKNPWEIFAWLPFGGWNECPDTPILMSVSKYWYEKYEAVPAVITHDTLEYDLPNPVDKDNAVQLAKEQSVWCPDIIDQGPEGATVGLLAEMLSNSTKWFFWWD